MSNLWLNLRIWCYHIQFGDPKWWSIYIRKNPVHENKPIYSIKLHELRWPW